MSATFFWLGLVMSLVNTGGLVAWWRAFWLRRTLLLPAQMREYVLGGMLIGWGPVQLIILIGQVLTGQVH